MSPVTPRRGFLRGIGATLAAMAAWPGTAMAAEAVEDEAWLRGLTGKHRQLFDVSVCKDGRPLGRLANFLDAYGEAYGLKDSDLNAVFGLHGSAVPMALDDAMWSKYELGKRNGENDPQTNAPAVRNPWAKGGPTSVSRLQERGVRFIVCMRSIRRLSGELAAGGGSAETIRAELLANLLPGVTPVPAMIVAVNRAHEAGLSYAYIG
jgi:intracellular sulfur oxidation DsrE/DsrF family protein